MRIFQRSLAQYWALFEQGQGQNITRETFSIYHKTKYQYYYKSWTLARKMTFCIDFKHIEINKNI